MEHRLLFPAAGSQACRTLRGSVNPPSDMLSFCTGAPAAPVSPGGHHMFRRGGTGWHVHSLIQKLNESLIKISSIHF